MNYTLKVAAISGEIVPLMAVAHAMALRDATAGGTPFHKPMYDGRYQGYIRDLLDEVRSGRLEVCNHYGSPIAVDPNVESTAHFGYPTCYQKEPDWKALRKKTPAVDLDWEAIRRDWKIVRLPGLNEPDWKKLQAKWDSLRDALPNTRRWKVLSRYWRELLLALSPLDLDWQHGFWNFSLIDLGPKMVDKDRPNNFWCAKLHLLNQWAGKRGDSFTISHDGVGWIDERGYIVLANQKVGRQSKGNNKSPNAKVPKVWKQDKDPLPSLSEIQPHKYYPTSQAAKFLGVSLKYLQNELVPEKKLAAQKRGGRHYILGEEILKYIRQYASNRETL